MRHPAFPPLSRRVNVRIPSSFHVWWWILSHGDRFDFWRMLLRFHFGLQNRDFEIPTLNTSIILASGFSYVTDLFQRFN
ncbi:hypothetical protein BDW62DRAFT_186201, partial [Aspergillus aurantiobrunneus]